MKLLFVAILFFFTDLCFSQVIINEIQSSNTSTLADNFGEYEDWIEIYNPNNFIVDIGGMVLKDNVDTWQIPVGDTSTLLSPKSYLLLWADDEEFQGAFHTNFKLSAANGEFLGLFEQDSITEIETVNFPPLLDNQSFGKCNESIWVVFSNPTPLKANDCSNSSIYSSKNEGLLVFPTISNGDISIDLPNYSGGIVNLCVFSMDGELVLNKQYNNKTFRIDLSNLSNELYLLNIFTENHLFIEKIIINK
jgi:hypothetical protein